MKLLRKSDGEWFPHPGGAQFLVGPVPAARAREIDVQLMGRTREIQFSRGKQTMTYDAEKLVRANHAKAEIALKDSKDCQIDAWDDQSAALLSKAAGRAVAVGEEITLDGHWTPEVKHLVFDAVQGLADWIVEKAKAFTFRAEEEEGKG